MSRPITERTFQKDITELAQRLGWRCYHHADSRRSTRGGQTWCSLRPPRALFVELKTNEGKMRPAQRETLELLARCDDMETYVWRPRHWAAIEEMLR